MNASITVALAGNPNAGKTTLFNYLTGARQHVGNYPGVTVEQKEGCCLHRQQGLRVVDLPGTYSLTAYSVEELVARDFLVNEKPDVVVDVVDASNLERHLYLGCQFLELGVPLVIALNMVDVAEKRGLTIDTEQLAQLLGVPVVPVVARTGAGVDKLLDAVLAVAAGQELAASAARATGLPWRRKRRDPCRAVPLTCASTAACQSAAFLVVRNSRTGIHSPRSQPGPRPTARTVAMTVDPIMLKEPSENPAQPLNDLADSCPRRNRWCRHNRGTPLHETCCRGRMRVCAVNGDRRTCAKMANLGLLPGTEVELLCSGGGRQCMIKVNGGTISLDALTAANILVDPL